MSGIAQLVTSPQLQSLEPTTSLPAAKRQTDKDTIELDPVGSAEGGESVPAEATNKAGARLEGPRDGPSDAEPVEKQDEPQSPTGKLAAGPPGGSEMSQLDSPVRQIRYATDLPPTPVSPFASPTSQR